MSPEKFDQHRRHIRQVTIQETGIHTSQGPRRATLERHHPSPGIRPELAQRVIDAVTRFSILASAESSLPEAVYNGIPPRLREEVVVNIDSHVNTSGIGRQRLQKETPVTFLSEGKPKHIHISSGRSRRLREKRAQEEHKANCKECMAGNTTAYSCQRKKSTLVK